MERVLIITDSNAGISQVEAKQLGIKIVPMPFIINGEEYYEDINLSQEEFYQKLSNENASVSTSQPSTYYLRETWDEALENYEEAVNEKRQQISRLNEKIRELEDGLSNLKRDFPTLKKAIEEWQEYQKSIDAQQGD